MPRQRDQFNLRICICLLGLACAVGAASGSVLRVDASAPPGGDGLTWNSALQHVRDAVSLAAIPGNGVTEIRIAGGVYRPDRSAANPQGSNDRTATLTIPSGVS